MFLLSENNPRDKLGQEELAQEGGGPAGDHRKFGNRITIPPSSWLWTSPACSAAGGAVSIPLTGRQSEPAPGTEQSRAYHRQTPALVLLFIIRPWPQRGRVIPAHVDVHSGDPIRSMDSHGVLFTASCTAFAHLGFGGP